MTKLNPYAIVYVDDEALALKYFEKGFSQEFDIFTANNAAEGWEIIQQHHSKIGVLMSDQRMPGQTGVELLERVRRAYPQIIRILVTAYADVDSAIAGVNEGAIYRYVSKPWDVADLRINLLRALEFFMVLVERDGLIREKLSTLQQIVLSDRAKNLGVLAAGLSCHFRHALRAANQFMAAVPQASGQTEALGGSRTALRKNIEALIKRASHHIFQISSMMKELAAEGTQFSPEPIPVKTLLGPLPQTGAEPGPSPFSLKINSSLPPLRANQKQIVKLFTLLVSNLAAVVQKSARLSVEAEAEETTGPAGGKAIRITLSDSGPDWASEQRHRFFAPFSSLRDEENRLGLNLAVCYFLVHHHGGRITVTSKENPRVTIDLPLDPLALEPELWQPSQLEELFQREQSWEQFLAPAT